MTPRREAVGLTLVIVGYSNGLALLAMRSGRAADIAYRWTNPPFLALILLGLARARGTTVRRLLQEAGLHPRKGFLAGGAGLALGLLLSGPPLLFFARPLVLDEPLEYGGIEHLSPRAFRRRLFVELPITVALFEEILFRGLLFESWARADGPRRAHGWAAATFAAWHLMVSVDTIRDTNIAEAATRVPRIIRDHADAVAVAGGLATTGVVGLLLGALRARTGGTIIGPALAHWIADAAMVAALHRSPPATRK